MATMRTATLELLERAKLPTEQALALAQAIELEVASQREAMVTRSDFLELRGEFRSELGPLKTDVAGLKADVSELKADVVQLKADVVQLKADVSELKADMSELKRGFAQLGNDMLEWKSEIRVEMHAIKAELVRWVFTVMLGQTAVLLGGGYFILSLLVA